MRRACSTVTASVNEYQDAVDFYGSAICFSVLCRSGNGNEGIH